MAGIECSPKIFDFRANGIPVQESVDFFDTLKRDMTDFSIRHIPFHIFRMLFLSKRLRMRVLMLKLLLYHHILDLHKSRSA